MSASAYSRSVTSVTRVTTLHQQTGRVTRVTRVTGGVLPGARPRSRIRTFRRMDGVAHIGGVRQFEVRATPPLCVFCGLCEAGPGALEGHGDHTTAAILRAKETAS
jgi:hypothetical protein